MNKYLVNISVKRILILIFTGIFVIILYCSNNLYFPEKEVYSSYYKYEDVYFKSSNNTMLNAWYIAPEEEMPTVLFSHGNGGNISYFFDMLIPAAEKGYGIFIYDYRGYGNSKGFPFEIGLYNDLRAAVKYLNENKNTHNNDIILWGLSLGGAVTSKIACENDFKAVILQSTFTNIKDMGLATLQKNLHLPYTEYLVNFVPFFQRYDTYSRIDKIKVPLLIIHSKNDSLIPYKLAEKNAKKAKFAKFHLVEQDNHNDYTNSLPIILDFLDSIK